MAYYKRIDLTGKKFGRLTVSEYVGGRGSKWRCLCTCGNICEVIGGNLRRGDHVSCGCFAKERKGADAPNYRHGLANTHEYRAYHRAKGRCTNPKNKDYKHYGGRGIKFNFESFEEFYKELGPCPDGMELDRENNGGHYELGNCRWISHSGNCFNRRPKGSLK